MRNHATTDNQTQNRNERRQNSINEMCFISTFRTQHNEAPIVGKFCSTKLREHDLLSLNLWQKIGVTLPSPTRAFCHRDIHLLLLDIQTTNTPLFVLLLLACFKDCPNISLKARREVQGAICESQLFYTPEEAVAKYQFSHCPITPNFLLAALQS